MSEQEQVAHVAKRAGWWIITFPELNEQTTATKRRSEVQEFAEALAATLLDKEPGEVPVTVEYIVPEAVRDEWEAARADQQRAQELSASAAQRTRAVVSQLRESGYNGREIADVLGISFQRVSQILKAAND